MGLRCLVQQVLSLPSLPPGLYLNLITPTLWRIKRYTLGAGSNVLLYKYKSPKPLEHLLDILSEERLYCPEYRALNDPFEGQFFSIFAVPLWFSVEHGFPAVPSSKRPASIEELAYQTGNRHVCSLSSTVSDVRMWSLYADGHRGVALEIDFDNFDESPRKVSYVESLTEWGTTLLAGATPEQVLSCKTDHWRYECEYRVIGSQHYLPIKGRLRRILLGVRASESLAGVLAKLAPRNVAIIRTELDHGGVSVRA